MKNKRGSHIGVMLSFVVFTTFLIFLYAIIQPEIRNQENKNPILDDLESEIIKKISIDLDIVSVYTNDTQITDTCIDLVNFSSAVNDSYVRVKDRLGNTLNQEFRPGRKDLRIEFAGTERKFFKVYGSSEFSSTETLVGGVCEALTKGNNYTLGITKTNNIIYEKKVVNTSIEYQTNYEGLKNTLNFPEDSDFDFRFITQNNTIIGPLEKDVKTSIYSKETPIIYIDDNGNILLGVLNIKVW